MRQEAQVLQINLRVHRASFEKYRDIFGMYKAFCTRLQRGATSIFESVRFFSELIISESTGFFCRENSPSSEKRRQILSDV